MDGKLRGCDVVAGVRWDVREDVLLVRHDRLSEESEHVAPYGAAETSQFSKDCRQRVAVPHWVGWPLLLARLNHIAGRFLT
jgi:hypothetical protein